MEGSAGDVFCIRTGRVLHRWKAINHSAASARRELSMGGRPAAGRTPLWYEQAG